MKNVLIFTMQLSGEKEYTLRLTYTILENVRFVSKWHAFSGEICLVLTTFLTLLFERNGCDRQVERWVFGEYVCIIIVHYHNTVS
jgi:hypothetical protein